jgi:hypothetical protein
MALDNGLGIGGLGGAPVATAGEKGGPKGARRAQGLSLADQAQGARADAEEHGVLEDGYRFFRVIQRGLNSSGNTMLCLSGMELYGTMFYDSEGMPQRRLRDNAMMDGSTGGHALGCHCPKCMDRAGTVHLGQWHLGLTDRPAE